MMPLPVAIAILVLLILGLWFVAKDIRVIWWNWRDAREGCGCEDEYEGITVERPYGEGWPD